MLTSRRDVMASLLALPFALTAAAEGDASPIDPTQTMVTLPERRRKSRRQRAGHDRNLRHRTDQSKMGRPGRPAPASRLDQEVLDPTRSLSIDIVRAMPSMVT